MMLFFFSEISGVTLLLIPDDGGNLPELSFPENQPSLVKKLCANSDSHQISCMAKATVVSRFANFGGTGANEKATMAGGLTASSPTSNGDIGLPGVKLLTSMPTPPHSPPFLGGAQFDHAVSTASQTTRNKEGCLPRPPAGPGCPPVPGDWLVADAVV